MLRIPYGRGFLEFEPGDAPVLRSRVGGLRSGAPGAELVRAAMEAPIGSPRLSELARGKKNCVIIISDHTCPYPAGTSCPTCSASCARAAPASG